MQLHELPPSSTSYAVEFHQSFAGFVLLLQFKKSVAQSSSLLSSFLISAFAFLFTCESFCSKTLSACKALARSLPWRLWRFCFPAGHQVPPQLPAQLSSDFAHQLLAGAQLPAQPPQQQLASAEVCDEGFGGAGFLCTGGEGCVGAGAAGAEWTSSASSPKLANAASCLTW